MTDEELAKKFLIGETCDTCHYCVRRGTKLECIVAHGTWGGEDCPSSFTCYRWVKNKQIIRRPKRNK